MMIGYVARMGIGAVIGTVVGGVLQPAARLVTTVIGGTMNTVADTAQSVFMTVDLGNDVVHRKTEMTKISGKYKDEVKRIQLIELQRESLIKYGENTEALKARYEELSDSTKNMIGMRETRFPEI